MTLFGKGKDWIKAPISGTLVLVCYAGAVISTYRGDLHGFLLWMIMADLTSIRRDKYLENYDG